MISPRISTQPDYSFTASRLIWKLDYSSLLPCVSSAFQILEMMRRKKKKRDVRQLHNSLFQKMTFIYRDTEEIT